LSDNGSGRRFGRDFAVDCASGVRLFLPTSTRRLNLLENGITSGTGKSPRQSLAGLTDDKEVDALFQYAGAHNVPFEMLL
jgi:hypothetical protein